MPSLSSLKHGAKLKASAFPVFASIQARPASAQSSVYTPGSSSSARLPSWLRATSLVLVRAPRHSASRHSAFVAMSDQVSSTRALCADVLRRAVSSLNRLRGTAVLGSTIAPRQSEGTLVGVVASNKVAVCARQRPNPSVERTHNGGRRRLVSHRPATPLCAAHVKR